MAKVFCKQCGLLLHPWTPMKEMLHMTRNTNLEPVEFSDGTYCKGCARSKRNSSKSAKKNKDDFNSMF